MLSLPSLPLNLPSLSDPDFQRLRRQYPDLRVNPEAGPCITCGTVGDKQPGTFRARHRGEVVEYQCNCRDQWTLHLVLLHCGIDLNYARACWDDIDTVPGKVQMRLMEYAENADKFIPSGIGLIMHGPNGTGKTLLTSLLLKALIEQGYDCYFTQFTEMLSAHSRGWRDREEEEWFIRRIRNAQVLGVDDIGKQNKGEVKIGADGQEEISNTSRSAQMVTSMFDQVIRARDAGDKPTIITTNWSPKQMQGGLGGSVMSLLAAACDDIEVTGLDYRDRVKQRRLEDSKEGLKRPVTLR